MEADGEPVCQSCGVVYDDVEMTRGFEGYSGGATLDHLADKNLPSTFRPEDVKDPDARAAFKRLARINKMAPQRKQSWVYSRLSRELRPFLERVYPPHDSSWKGTDKVGQVLEYAAKLAKKHSLPQSLPHRPEAMAYLCIVHTDSNLLIPFRMGSEKLIAKIIGQSEPGETLDVVASGIPTGFTMRAFGNSCAWEGSFKFEPKNSTRAGEDVVELTAAINLHGHQFSLSVPITVCKNQLGHSEPANAHRGLDGEQSIMFLTASKHICALNKPVKVTVRLQPAPKCDSPITGKLHIRHGRKGAEVLSSYKHLCQHYSIPVNPVTAVDIVTNDPKLNPEERTRASSLARLIDKTFKSTPTLQRLSPETTAALAVIQIGNISAAEIAEHYRVDSSTLKTKLAKWQATQIIDQAMH